MENVYKYWTLTDAKYKELQEAMDPKNTHSDFKEQVVFDDKHIVDIEVFSNCIDPCLMDEWGCEINTGDLVLSLLPGQTFSVTDEDRQIRYNVILQLKD